MTANAADFPNVAVTVSTAEKGGEWVENAAGGTAAADSDRESGELREADAELSPVADAESNGTGHQDQRETADARGCGAPKAGATAPATSADGPDARQQQQEEAGACGSGHSLQGSACISFSLDSELCDSGDEVSAPPTHRTAVEPMQALQDRQAVEVVRSREAQNLAADRSNGSRRFSHCPGERLQQHTRRSPPPAPTVTAAAAAREPPIVHCRGNAQHRDHSSRDRCADAPADLQLAASDRQTHQSGLAAATSAEAPAATANLTERLRLRALKFGTVLPPASGQPMAAARPGAAGVVRAASGSPAGRDLTGHAQQRGTEARQLLQRQRQDGRQERGGGTKQLTSQDSARNVPSRAAQPGPAREVHLPARHVEGGSGSLRGGVPRAHRAPQEALVLDAPVLDSRARGDWQRPHRREQLDQQAPQRDQHGSRHLGLRHHAGATQASRPPEATAVPAGQVRGREASPLLQRAALPPPAETKKRKGRGFSDPGASASGALRMLSAEETAPTLQTHEGAWDNGQRQHLHMSDSGAAVHTATAGGASNLVESSGLPQHGSSRDNESRHFAAAAVEQQPKQPSSGYHAGKPEPAATAVRLGRTSRQHHRGGEGRKRSGNLLPASEHTAQGVSQIASSSAGQDGLSRLRRMALAAQKRVRR